MELEYPSQRFQDWLSQRWVMACGRRVDPADVPWLMGPFGESDAIADEYIARLAAAESLAVERNAPAGIFDEMRELVGESAALLHPSVRRFYERTCEYDLDAWAEWNPFFRPFASLIRTLYSRRLRQLNLPLRPLETSRGVKSEIIRMRRADGTVRYTVWFRRLKSTGLVIYSGVYGTTVLPDGRRCAKIVFPLPRGNATVVMVPSVRDGVLELVSRGRRFGDAGFYFLLRDKRGRHWAQHIPSFRETIRVYVDEEGELRADHELNPWGIVALRLHYRMSTARAAAPDELPQSVELGGSV